MGAEAINQELKDLLKDKVAYEPNADDEDLIDCIYYDKDLDYTLIATSDSRRGALHEVIYKARTDQRFDLERFLANARVANDPANNSALSAEVCDDLLLPAGTDDAVCIDAEIIAERLPEGSFCVRVNNDSFDERQFEYYVGEDVDPAGFVEIMLVANSPEGAYCVQGEIVFVDLRESHPDFIYTGETEVKLSSDVSLIKPGDSISAIGAQARALPGVRP